MNSHEMAQFLIDNMRVELEVKSDYYHSYLHVSLFLNDSRICTDSIQLSALED